MATATLLLPHRDAFAGQGLSQPLAQALGRADRTTVDGDQRARILDVLPRGWPAAAATRQRDVGDAAHGAWLRADPAHVRADINGARLLGYGAALSLTAQDSAAFLPALRPLFGNAGFQLDAPTPTRWYLKLPQGARLPTFTPPEDALGADVFDHLPGSTESSPEARRWRTLASEAQVVLHNHPRNAERAQAGLPAINSLWFWGASVLPDHVRSAFAQVRTRDDALDAMAALASVTASAPGDGWAPVEADTAIDLRDARQWRTVEASWVTPALAELRSGGLDALVLDFADGGRFSLAPRQRWRFWRRPLRALASTP